jgi:hypothetical protein
MNETVEPDELVPLLTEDEVAILNAARVVLRDTQRRTTQYERLRDCDARQGADLGAARALADVSEDSLFRVLNWLNACGVLPLTDQQLHIR